MSAASIAIPKSPNSGIAAFAAALPVDLPHSPLFGILGVVMGAGIVTLAGRLLTLGAADLRGHRGLSFDDGAWMGSAFNVALMFIGPFTVYLGGLLGPRRVLLTAASVFTLVSLALPFVQSYSVLIFLLVLAGLSSGTFYPLTLTFALRNIPLRYLALTVGLYATSVEGAVNFAPWLYGIFRNHDAWQWMFWTQAVITPLMMLCIYFGIPAAPATKRTGPAPSFAGFLYASAGLGLLFAALDQGERLDWWRSGLFNSMVAGGFFFLFLALVRRLKQPNPLVDVPYLRQWNTVLLGVGLFAFRFCLLATIIVIPQSLSARGLDAAQFAPAVVWIAVPELCLTFLAAHLLNKGADSHLIMAIGFTAIAFACVFNADFTSVWNAQNYFRTELLMAAGQSFAFIGLVTSIILQAIASGGLASAQRVLTFSAYFHVVRLFGGEAGVSFMTHFIAQQEKLHSNLVGLHVESGSWMADGGLRMLTAGVYAKSSGWASAAERATVLLAAKLRLQAYALTFIDAFHLVAWACFGMVVLVALLRRSPLGYRELSAVRVEARA
jgi:DHA2 family multidrug resistance protein